MLQFYTLLISHITLNPNFGAYSGDYFHTTLRIPHGAPGLHTTQLVINVPKGILVLKPEVPDHWSSEILTRELEEDEQYSSHGILKTTAPQTIILTSETHAEGLHDDHLMNIDMQLKIGCVFGDESNTIWNDEYTLWWSLDQICEDSTGNRIVLSWNGTQMDTNGMSPSWSSLPSGIQPAPYLYIEPGTRCNIEHIGEESIQGLVWFGINKENEIINVATIRENENSTLMYITLIISILAIIASSLSFLLWILLVCIRCKNKKQFTEKLLGVEYCKCKELETTTTTIIT
jgi:hypothetical protein